jgi:hypothetical protein
LTELRERAHTIAMARSQVPLFALESPYQGTDALVHSAQKTIESLREQGAIEAWHELDCTIVLELAQAVTESRGIAKSQMFGALLAARARLPEPIVAAIDADQLEYEGQRALEYFGRYSADLSNEETAEPLV